MSFSKTCSVLVTYYSLLDPLSFSISPLSSVKASVSEVEPAREPDRMQYFGICTFEEQTKGVLINAMTLFRYPLVFVNAETPAHRIERDKIGRYLRANLCFFRQVQTQTPQR